MQPRNGSDDERCDGGQQELADEEDQQKHDDRRDVDAAEIRQQAADRRQHRLGDAEQEIADGADELVARVDDVEGVEPGEDRRSDENPSVEVESQNQCLNEGEHAVLH